MGEYEKDFDSFEEACDWWSLNIARHINLSGWFVLSRQRYSIPVPIQHLVARGGVCWTLYAMCVFESSYE